MAQAESRLTEMSEQAQTLRSQMIRIFSRDGLIDEEEVAALKTVGRHINEIDAKADEEALIVALMRRGRSSSRVHRLAGQIFATTGRRAQDSDHQEGMRR